ncbi:MULTISPECIES: GTPase Era [Nitrosomonas]|uniref:GTPase Era n=2 Tax=Nitrosomonas eutropha TaxID=916 RepID=ERA_NITEC|nr:MULTISPECIES: GTPase Era [Nitrosomonas]Q0AF71.1 RecName: Full=GTPase Era [Nitrosomonas eutropha C91]ABI60011.1 GTP-binding protein Era [Nitrosomonas eutropha C91]MXS79351.1 GTPase Era [Nitrosomonas sp. GH22]PXV77234.1 GTP-binding protein Era [Nitrosomonas eutropha]SEI94576.1 GTP-binding protein Era [Nitrosomonas eutropha]
MSASGYKAGYISIVGRPNVGKSTLLNHLIKQKISITSRKAQTTRHRIHGILTDVQSQFIFVDTPGFQMRHRSQLNQVMNRVVLQSMQDVDVILFVLEAGRFGREDEQVLEQLPRNLPVILVINKIDLLPDKLQLLPFMQKMADLFDFADIVPVSALQNRQLSDLTEVIRHYLPENPPVFTEDEITDRSERFLAAELLREKVFRQIGEEVPYSVSVIIEQFAVEGNLRRIHACILVERENQKAIIIGKQGKKLKDMATQARKDMEVLFDGKVYLEIWVKVKSGWADDAIALKSMGYE